MFFSKSNKSKKGKLEILDKNDLLSRRLIEMGCRNGMETELILSCGKLIEIRIGETLFALKKIRCSNFFADI